MTTVADPCGVGCAGGAAASTKRGDGMKTSNGKLLALATKAAAWHVVEKP